MRWLSLFLVVGAVVVGVMVVQSLGSLGDSCRAADGFSAAQPGTLEP